jgi:hypothetical protein
MTPKTKNTALKPSKTLAPWSSSSISKVWMIATFGYITKLTQK